MSIRIRLFLGLCITSHTKIYENHKEDFIDIETYNDIDRSDETIACCSAPKGSNEMRHPLTAEQQIAALRKGDDELSAPLAKNTAANYDGIPRKTNTVTIRYPISERRFL